MSHRWGAYITTVDHRLEYVEFETPGINRDAAVAQCKSMYGARSVENCHPVSDDSYDDNHSSSSSSDTSGIFALCVLGGGCWLAYEAWKLGSAVVMSAWQWIVGAAQWFMGLIPFMSPQLFVGLVLGFFFLVLVLGALDD